MTVVLIGTRHDYQRPRADGAEAFRAVVLAACREGHIKALAEEMSLDALALYGATQSVCEQVAAALRIPHRYCDPPRQEQLELGVFNPGAEGDPAADGVRRRRWLECIRELNQWPVLFVCGANHVEAFQGLLEANGIRAAVLVPRWSPRLR